MIFCVLAVAALLPHSVSNCEWLYLATTSLAGGSITTSVMLPQEKPEPIDSKPRPSPSDQDHFSVYQSESFLDTDLVVKLKMAGQGTNTSNVIGQNKSDPTKVILELSINLATDVFPPFNLQRFSVSIDFRKTKEQLCLAK